MVLAVLMVTVYGCTELSIAVTVYETGLLKFWATADAGDIIAFCERVNVGANLVKSVPIDTVALTVWITESTTPVTVGVRLANVNDSIALPELTGCVSIELLQAVINKTNPVSCSSEVDNFLNISHVN